MLVIAAISSYRWENERKTDEKSKFVDTGSTGYIPLDDTEKEISFPINDLEPRAGNMALTADGGLIETKQVDPVKKKLEIQNLLKGKLPKLKLTKLKEIKEKILTSKFNLNLSQKLSWKNLTDYSKSPILNLLKRLMSLIKK
jgi:hypothetical protein